MTDYDMILHDMIVTRGAESVVRQMLASDNIHFKMLEHFPDWTFDKIDDKQIRFEASRAAYKIAQRNKR